MKIYMRKIKKSILTIIVVLACSCSGIFEEKLSMKRVNYDGNELRTDGYYYYLNNGNVSTQVRFLYKNGVGLCANSYASHDLNSVEHEMVMYYPNTIKRKENWGLFMISGSTIEIEEWTIEIPRRVTVAKSMGYIENDTTFRLTEHYFSGIKYTYSERWHFKQFDNKPDSTNNFIK